MACVKTEETNSSCDTSANNPSLQKLASIEEYMRSVDKDLTLQVMTMLIAGLSVLGPLIMALMTDPENVSKFLGKWAMYWGQEQTDTVKIRMISGIMVYWGGAYFFTIFSLLKIFLVYKSYTFRHLQYSASILENSLGIASRIPADWNTEDKQFTLGTFMPEIYKFFFIGALLIELGAYGVIGVFIRLAAVQGKIHLIFHLGMIVVVSLAISIFAIAAYKIKLNKKLKKKN